MSRIQWLLCVIYLWQKLIIYHPITPHHSLKQGMMRYVTLVIVWNNCIRKIAFKMKLINIIIILIEICPAWNWRDLHIVTTKICLKLRNELQKFPGRLNSILQRQSLLSKQPVVRIDMECFNGCRHSHPLVRQRRVIWSGIPETDFVVRNLEDLVFQLIMFFCKTIVHFIPHRCNTGNSK